MKEYVSVPTKGSLNVVVTSVTSVTLWRTNSFSWSLYLPPNDTYLLPCHGTSRKKKKYDALMYLYSIQGILQNCKVKFVSNILEHKIENTGVDWTLNIRPINICRPCLSYICNAWPSAHTKKPFVYQAKKTSSKHKFGWQTHVMS